jgi:hypothetical protein
MKRRTGRRWRKERRWRKRKRRRKTTTTSTGRPQETKDKYRRRAQRFRG